VDVVAVADLADDVVQAQPGGLLAVGDDGRGRVLLGDGQIALGDDVLDGLEAVGASGSDQVGCEIIYGVALSAGDLEADWTGSACVL